METSYICMLSLYSDHTNNLCIGSMLTYAIFSVVFKKMILYVLIRYSWFCGLYFSGLRMRLYDWLPSSENYKSLGSNWRNRKLVPLFFIFISYMNNIPLFLTLRTSSQALLLWLRKMCTTRRWETQSRPNNPNILQRVKR